MYQAEKTRMERLQEFFMNDFTNPDMSNIRPMESDGNEYSQMMMQSNPSQSGLIHLQPVANSY